MMSPEEVERADSASSLLPTSLVINMSATRSYLRMYKILRRGYSSLCMFLLLMLVFCTWIAVERQTVEFLTENAAVQSAVVAPESVQSLPQFWHWMRTKMVPAVFAEAWEMERHGDTLRGYQLTAYNYVVGGMLLNFATREPIPCPHATDFTPSAQCYSPADSDISQSRQLLSAISSNSKLLQRISEYESTGLLPKSVERIQLRVVVANPSRNSFTLLTITFRIDLAGAWHNTAWAQTIPQSMSQDLSKVVLLAMMVILWAVTLWWFVYSWLYREQKCGTPSKYAPVVKRRESKWFTTPVDGNGVPYRLNKLMVLALVFLGLCVWILQMVQFQKLTLHATSFKALYSDSDQAVIRVLQPFIEAVTLITSTSRFSGQLATVNCGFMLFHLFELMAFQNKINVITSTFVSLVSEISHLFLVIFITICCFAFMGVLSFGEHCHDFSDYQTAFWTVTEMVFANLTFLEKKEMLLTSRLSTQIFTTVFKLITVLLLLKMVMAMIFESYKKHHGEKKRSGANSVLGDLKVIFHHFGHYVQWVMSDSYYVPPGTVLRIISHPLFEERSGGFLNVFELRAAVDMTFKEQELNLGHVHWILRTYGQQSAHPAGVSYGTTTTADIFNENLIKETFSVVDRDRDGKVSVKELRAALRGMGQRFTDKALDRMIAQLGVELDSVDETDWVTICRDLHRVMSFDIGSKLDEELLGMEFAHQYDDQSKLDTPPDTPTPGLTPTPSGESRNLGSAVDKFPQGLNLDCVAKTFPPSLPMDSEMKVRPGDSSAAVSELEMMTMITQDAMSSSSSTDDLEGQHGEGDLK